MAKTTILFGILLIALGVVGYAGSEPKAKAEPPANQATATENSVDQRSEPAKKSVTALIPAMFGVLLMVCGLLALKESLLRHAMHTAAMVGLLGAVASAGRGAMGIGKFLSGDPELNQRSFLFVWMMASLCGVFVFLCVLSFITARKKNAAET